MIPSDPFDLTSYADAFKKIGIQDTDLLLLYLALTSLRLEGHRYGSFLDAAATAAKFAVYATYLAEGKKLRRAGLVHHIEAKRVKIIVQEVEAILNHRQNAKILGQREPEYLIGIPHLWTEKYPWAPNLPRVRRLGLASHEQAALASQLPSDAPLAQILGLMEFQELLSEMHRISQSHLPQSDQHGLSDAMAEHMVFNLLNSGTVLQFHLPDAGSTIDLYGLARNFYSPQEKAARVRSLMRDTARFMEILQLWLHKSPRVMRAMEVLEIPEENRDAAFRELDQLIHDWADRHHAEGEKMVALHMAVGDYHASIYD